MLRGCLPSWNPKHRLDIGVSNCLFSIRWTEFDQKTTPGFGPFLYIDNGLGWDWFSQGWADLTRTPAGTGDRQLTGVDGAFMVSETGS